MVSNHGGRQLLARGLDARRAARRGQGGRQQGRRDPRRRRAPSVGRAHRARARRQGRHAGPAVHVRPGNWRRARARSGCSTSSRPASATKRCSAASPASATCRPTSWCARAADGSRRLEIGGRRPGAVPRRGGPGQRGWPRIAAAAGTAARGAFAPAGRDARRVASAGASGRPHVPAAVARSSCKTRAECRCIGVSGGGAPAGRSSAVRRASIASVKTRSSGSRQHVRQGSGVDTGSARSTGSAKTGSSLAHVPSS